jgi:methyl-accepting chemotaxis protein
MSWIRGPLLAILAGALLAAGCGGSEDETSGADEWASSVCSATTTWTASVSAAATSLQGGNLSENSLESAVDDVTDATKTFADELQDVGRPDTEDGQQAKDSLDQLGKDIEEGVQQLEDAVDSASGGSGMLDAIAQISSTLATMSSQVTGTVDELGQLDPAGELDDALKNNDECSSLRSGG